MQNSNYKNHLYFEDRKESKEYALNKCIKILALIAILKDKNESNRSFYNDIYGENRMPLSESVKYRQNLKTIKRLRGYYNNLIKKLGMFAKV